MADVIDIDKVIRGSTSDMTIDSLTKKGVKQVKVLDQATIVRLISKLVDKVLSQRAETIDGDERDRIIRDTKDQLNVGGLKKGIQAANDEIAHKDRRNSELQGQLEAKEQQLAQLSHLENDCLAMNRKIAELQGQLEAKEAQIAENSSRGDGGLAQVLTLLTTQMQQGAAADGASVAAAIESLTKKIERMPAGGGGGGHDDAPVPDEIALDFLIEGGEGFESNISNVQVRQAKAGDVKGALDKLKKLQKGGE